MRDERLEHGPAPAPVNFVAGRPVEVEEALHIFGSQRVPVRKSTSKSGAHALSWRRVDGVEVTETRRDILIYALARTIDSCHLSRPHLNR